MRRRLWLCLWIVTALLGALMPRPAAAVGLCGTYKTFGSSEVLTASDLNNSLVQAATTNSTPQCVDDYSATVAQMQTRTDPGAVGSESLPTSLSGELERLRFALRRLHGQAQWYTSPSPFNPPGDIAVGVANSLTQRVIFYHSASGFTTSLSSGISTATADYLLPTAAPSGARFLSTDSTAAMSWIQVNLGNSAHITGTLPFGNGGTGVATALDDTTLVSSGSAWVATALPQCVGGTSALQYTVATNLFSCGALTTGIQTGDSPTLTGTWTWSGTGPRMQSTAADSQLFFGGSTDPGWSVNAVQMQTGRGYFVTSGGVFSMGFNVYYDGTDRHIITDTAAVIRFSNVPNITFETDISRVAATATANTIQMTITGSGVQIGAPTGGAPGVGAINAAAAYQSNGVVGQSVTTTVRASGGAADCTLIFTGGLKTGGSC